MVQAHLLASSTFLTRIDYAFLIRLPSSYTAAAMYLYFFLYASFVVGHFQCFLCINMFFTPTVGLDHSLCQRQYGYCTFV